MNFAPDSQRRHDPQEAATPVDERLLHAGRLDKLRAELARRDYAGALLCDPINVRYATGTRNMAVWTLHSPGRYAFVSTDGPVILFEFGTSLHVSAGSGSVDEVRTSTPWFYFLAGPRVAEKARQWASEIVELVSRHGAGNRRLAVDRCEPWGARLLEAAGVELFDAQEPLEQARLVKSPEEIRCMYRSMEVCDLAIERMRSALRPGMTENELWSILHQTNIANDGEWIECRLLASGPRTNPWFQECSPRVIEAGDMVCFDTDMIGPAGYLADVSRAFVCPGLRPTAQQRRLYEIAQDQVLHNIELLRPGVSFREFSERCWSVPREFTQNRYMMMVHGAGLADEYPSLVYIQDFDGWGYDGMFLENMVVCVESYIGETGGPQGVKLEQQVLITREGPVTMSRSLFIDALEI